MEQQFYDESFKSVKITFGSCLTLSLADMQHCFVQSDGFLQSKLELKNFKRAIGNRQHDFQNCVFKILPPIDNKSQQKLLEVLDAKKFHQLNLNQRKTLILELQQNLDGEINSNMSTQNKLNGTPVLFSTSSFHLIHLASMKFVSLTKDKSDSYIFTLTDYPNEKSLFKFLPCLSLQKQRSNIVMNKDVVQVCCTGLVHSRKGYLYTNYSNKKNGKEFEVQQLKIYANLENPCRWVVNSYSQCEQEGEQSFISIGNVISLDLSDRNFCLSASKASDPFENLCQQRERQMAYDNLGASFMQKEGNSFQQGVYPRKKGAQKNNSSSFLVVQNNQNNNQNYLKDPSEFNTPVYPSQHNIQPVKMIQQTTASQIEDYQISNNQQFFHNQMLDVSNDHQNINPLKLKPGASYMQNIENNNEKNQNDFLKINQNLSAEEQRQFELEEQELREIKEQLQNENQVFFEQAINEQTLSSSKEQSILFAFWKIEPIFMYSGGYIKWNEVYRLKHFITGKYLTVRVFQQPKANPIEGVDTFVYLDLTDQDDLGTHFSFIPITQQKNNEQSKMVMKESFYRLQNVQTKLYIGFKDEPFEEGEIEQFQQRRTPFLEQDESKISIFKMRIVNFEEMWETNFILYSMQFLMNQLKNLNLLKYKSEEQKWRYRVYFRQVLQEVNDAIIGIDSYINNQITSFIDVQQEYSKPSPKRQKIIREQHMIGMLCWILKIIFPQYKEFHKIAPSYYERMEFLKIYKSTNWPIIKEYDLSTEKQRQMSILKFEEEVFAKSYRISFQVYKLLESVCSNNVVNQEYLTRFFKIIVSHIGYGDFVCQSIQKIFQNAQILQDLVKKKIEDSNEQTNQGSQRNYGYLGVQNDYLLANNRSFNNNKMNNSSSDNENSFEKRNGLSLFQGQKTFLKEIVDKFSMFEAYILPELIQLLANFCVVNNNALYIIQEYVFNLIFTDKQLTRYCLIPIEMVPKDSDNLKDLKIQILPTSKDNIQQDMESLIKLISFDQQSNEIIEKQIIYLQQQLILMANLCKDRNFKACNEFSQIFPLSVLVQFIIDQNKNKNIQLLAGFLKIIMNIYIDKFPNQKQTRPNLVRIVNLEAIKSVTNLQNNPAGDGDISVDAKRNVNNLMSAGSGIRTTVNGRKQSYHFNNRMRQKSIKYNVEDKYNVNKAFLLNGAQQNNQQDFQYQLQLTKLKDQLLKHLEEQVKILQYQEKSNKNESQQGKKAQVYNVFMLELIHTLTTMLQFGILHERTGLKQQKQQKDKLSFLAYFQILKQDQKQEVSELERIISALAVLLEYDETYFQELDSLHVRRKYVQHQRAKRDNVYAKVLNQTKTITNILTKNEDKSKEKQKLYNNNLDFESDIIKDPIFKKFQGLKKILFQYTNKTFSVREKNEHIDIEEQIKIKICEFFSFLLDMRQDFFIDNIISYFQQKFCEYKKEETVKVVDDVLELLPNDFTEVGHVVKSEKVKIYTQRYRIQSIDEVLDRPFMECLLVSFYFAQSGELENKIIELLQRCISQKNEVFNNLLKLELIFSKQHQELYNILNEIFIELKNIVSDSQTWLNLENDDDYNYVKTEDLIVRTVKIFKNQQDKENLAVIQSIFKHIGGHQCLIDLIDKGLNVIENSGFYIQNLDYLQMNEQWDAQELFEKLISILKNSFQALSAYCLNNKENQEFMYKKFFKNLISQKKHNIGQIEFINDLFRDNYELSINIQFQDLQYFIQMIKLHGKQHQFLEIFQILLNNVEQKQDFYVLQNLLLNLFFDEIIFQTISPFAKKETGVTFFQTDYFFDNKIDEQKYKSIFTILISRLMSDEMEQSQIMKVSYFIPALELLKYLRERTVSYRQMNIKDIQVIEQNIKVNAAIIELILFLSSSKEFAQTLPQNTKLIVEIVEFETMKLERAQTYSESYKFYLIDNLLPLINYYSENYLKDLLFSENSNEVDQRKKLYKFAYTFINSLDKVLNFKQEELLENDRGKQLKVLSKHYDFQIPFNIMGERNNLDSNSDKFYELNDDEMQLLPNKNRLKKKSFKTMINEEEPKETKSKKQKDQTVRNINMIEYWLHFKKKLQEDFRFKCILKDEKKILCQSILKIQNMFQTPNQQRKRDIILTSDDILSKILKFIEFWRQKNVPMKSVIFVMKIMNYIIKNAFSIQEEDENLMDVFKQSSQKIQKNEQTKIRQERQEQLDRLNSSKIVIMLIWEECENNAEYLNSLFKFMNLMLKGGNVSVQKTIYEYFLGSQASEKFFAKVNRIFQAQITKNSMFGRKNSEKMILKILKLFQLLCLNHNQDLQNYMRKQISNKNSYDLVSTTVKLLISYRVSKETYKTIKQCFNTLTEFVQGPCIENQDTITNTKFLEYAFQILSEDEKLFLKTDIQQDERQRQLLLLQNEQTNIKLETNSNGLNQNDETNLETAMTKQKKNQQKKIHFQQSDQPTTSNALSKNPGKNVDSHTEYDFSKTGDNMQQKSNKNKQKNLFRSKTIDVDQLSEEKQSKEESVKQEEYLRQQKFQIHLGELARLKYKCLLTIISILECNYSKKDLISKIMRIIPVSVLTKNLTRVYQLYKKHFKKQDYNIYLFKQMKAQIDYNKPPDYYEFVIENGFLVYMLIQLYIQNNVLIETEDEDEDMTSVLNEFKKSEENIFTEMLKEKDNIFSNMMKFGRDLITVGKNALNEIKENAYKFGVIQLNKKEQQEKERLEKKELIKNALIFFKNKTCSIEIVRNGCLQTISFPKMPLCFTLSDEIKDDFRINVNRSSHKEKLSYLIDQSGKIIDKITHEENVRLIVEEYKFVGIFVMYNHLWQRLSFYLALAINALIIASYSDAAFVYDSDLSAQKNKDNLEYARRQQPRFFYNTYYDNTGNLIILLGTISSILISVIVSFFILKRAPLILGSVWYGFLSSSLPIWKKSIFFILKSIYSIYLLMQDFDIIYYLFQLFFVMLGLFAHPFYFCGLLIDMLRFNVLSNVFHAVYDPKVELGLTILLFAIIEYYFTIFAYIIFYNHYIHEECQTFWKCYLKNFDYTFKSVGALGHFLYEPQTLSEVGGDTSKYLGVNQSYQDKYFSRFFFDNIFQIVLAHVIIYIFGGIIIDKYRQLKDAKNRKQQDEKKNCFICGFDRQTLDKGDDILGFYYHIRQEHYMWNYIFYMAYLQLKDKVMYNGDEMYIFKKIEKNDISWIPKKRTKRIIDDQEIEKEKLKYVKQINNTMKQLNEQIEKITQKQKQIIKQQKQASSEVFDIIDQQKAQQLQQPQ
ncbi:hypothetical protein ABPG74_013921 [Tetrahymena malaccensis]